MGILKIKTTSSPSPFAPISFRTIQWLLSEPRIHEKCTTSDHISSELYHTLFWCNHTLHLSFFLFILYNYVIHFSYSYSNSPHEFSSHHYFTCSSHLMLSPILSLLFLGLLLYNHSLIHSFIFLGLWHKWYYELRRLYIVLVKVKVHYLNRWCAICVSWLI